MEERLLRLREVENMTGMTRSTIYRKMPLGRFPRPYRLGEGGGVRWKKTEVDAWIAAMAATGGASKEDPRRDAA